ncbi:Pyruvate kinase [Mycena kentingensis (nom. inval.)]|nr:Pyruvate kinase [Mycena kentingensis (nom. inval.)]
MSAFSHRRSGSFRRSLPHFAPFDREDDKYRRNLQWFLPIPGLGRRGPRLLLNPRRLHHFSTTRFGARRGLLVLLFGLVTFVFLSFALAKKIVKPEQPWTAFVQVCHISRFSNSYKPLQDPPTLVFRREDIQRIWKWEIMSGHYPSRRRIPDAVWLDKILDNPALPPRRGVQPPRTGGTTTRGVGARRVYLDNNQLKNVAYPPRPVPGSLADLDIIMEHCDFSEKKYVRDCLEVLRFGAGLDNGRRLRRGNLHDWQYIYKNLERTDAKPDAVEEPESGITAITRDSGIDPDSGLTKKKGVEWEPPLQLPSARQYEQPTAESPCDPENPRVFHAFWTGPFTDKPYLMLLSFLFTQRTDLHLKDDSESKGVCRPTFWLWINPGPAAAVPNPTAVRDMEMQLKNNPWSAPFLHPRFKDVIQFKLWNTTDQLDSIPELRDPATGWRAHARSLFNSGGHVINVPAQEKEEKVSIGGENANVTVKVDDDDILKRTGSKSSSSYDKLSVILSDMARFVLCHRFGGIYLDADTILLRDWEELWGHMAFAYRWSRLPKYNTAVLRMNRFSALGTFLFRTALKNDLDFHPMTISRYLHEAHLEGLLLRLPDALFDPAWLNTEYYQRDRPPQPYFTELDILPFSRAPILIYAAPHALGFDGFFKGAYSYHYHNFWWRPFDGVRNWPELGPRFIEGEKLARERLRAKTASAESTRTGGVRDEEEKEDIVDQKDLDWSMVLKRTFESYIRGERPNMYGEYLEWRDT